MIFQSYGQTIFSKTKEDALKKAQEMFGIVNPTVTQLTWGDQRTEHASTPRKGKPK